MHFLMQKHHYRQGRSGFCPLCGSFLSLCGTFHCNSSLPIVFAGIRTKLSQLRQCRRSGSAPDQGDAHGNTPSRRHRHTGAWEVSRRLPIHRRPLLGRGAASLAGGLRHGRQDNCEREVDRVSSGSRLHLPPHQRTHHVDITINAVLHTFDTVNSAKTATTTPALPILTKTPTNPPITALTSLNTDTPAA